MNINPFNRKHPLDEIDFEILGNLEDLGWASYSEMGGSRDNSYNTRIRKLFKRGLVERRDVSDLRSRRPRYEYKITDKGEEALRIDREDQA